MDHKVKKIIHVNANLIKDLAQKFNSYYSDDITAKKIIAFLLQFEEYEKIKFALKLISNINFLSSRKITYLIKTAYQKIGPKDKLQPLIAPLGTSQDSSALVCYSLFKDIFDDEANALASVIEVTQIENELINTNPTSLIFIDDNITSGTQLRDFFDELIIGSPNPELIPKPLSDKSVDKLRQIPIYICYAIRLTEECQAVVDNIVLKHNIDLKIYSGAEDYYNYTEFSSPIIDSPEESIEIKQMVIEYSKSLYEDKKWSKEKLYDRLIGYGNLGKLIVFNHNVPKSFIPFFWKAGIVNGKPWIPLFPERQEMKKIEKNNYQFETYLYEVANMLLTEINITREPDINFYLSPLNGALDEKENLIFDIPDDESLSKVFKSLHDSEREYGYEKNEFYPYPGYTFLHASRGYHSEKESLFNERYDEYKEYIDKVNLGIQDYLDSFELYLTDYSGRGKLNVYIENTGIGAANNVRLRLHYHSDELMFDKTDVLVPPYKNSSFELKKVEDFQFSSHSFNNDELFTPFQYNIEISGKKFRKDMRLSLTLNFPKISHKDSLERTLDYIIMDRNKEYIVLKYELLWDESIDGLNGEIKIFINKVPRSEKELSYLYEQIEN